jgi:hypothetical protein
VALRVPDVDASAAHAIRTLGLMETPSGVPGTRLLSSNVRHHELQLIQADECALDHVGLEVEHAELSVLHDRVSSAGFEVSDDSPEEGLASAFRLTGPLGIVFEIYAGMTALEPTVQRQVGGYARRLGHVTFQLREKDELIAFLIDVLGFRVSDELGDFQWLRCDTLHHGIAAGSGFASDRLHHYAFELEGWAGMLRYLDNLAVAEDILLTGPGRHGPGFNLFTYTLDPAGVVLEAYADMLRIENEDTYEPVDWSTVPNALSLWDGAMPDPSFFELGAPVTAVSALKR